MSTIVKAKAKDYISGNNIQVGVLPYGDEVIHNNPDKVGDDSASYVVNLTTAGLYTIFVEHAAKTTRPISITFNGVVATRNGLSEITDCWEEKCQKWFQQVQIQARAGANDLKFHCGGVFPHIKTFALVSADLVNAYPLDEVIKKIKDAPYGWSSPV